MKQITCPSCSARFDVSTQPAGKKFRCGRCKEILTVPEDEPLPEPESALDALDDGAFGDSEAAFEDGAAAEQAAGAEAGAAAAEEAAEAPPAEEEAAAPEPAPAPRARAGSRAPAARPAARPAPPASARRGAARPAARKPAAPAGEEGGEPLPQKMSPLPRILAAVLVLAVLGGGGFFAWKKFGKGGEGTGDGQSAVGDEYAKKLKKLEKSSGIDNLRLALWCKARGHEKYAFHLDEAAKLSPNDAQVKAGLANQYWTLAAEKPPTSAAGCLDAAALAVKAGLESEKRRLARLATAMEPDNAAAWELLGCARYEPEGGTPRWLPKAEAAKAKIADDERKAAQAKIESMTPREKRIAEMRQRLMFEFGPGFVCRDEKPFLFCMEKSEGFSAELVMDSYISELKSFYQRFFDRFGEKFKLGDLTEQVMLIWIFKSREAYFTYGQNIGIPANAGGHWEPDKERLMIFHSTDATADPYGTIFHETTHMIVTFATKLRGKVSGQMFWFTEGIATYFEPFERDKQTGKILQQVGTINGGRLPAISQWVKMGRHVKLKDMFSWRYQDFAMMNAQHNARRDLAWGAYCYAQAWSLLYFFYNYENGKYAAKFEEYFKEELDGNPGFETFKRIFGTDIDALEKEWLEYTKSLK
ncbi:MAG: DUF1570 domain-containing protein [Planctomycetia bacterium]|nr:DUF1570 domain-containing protein [Planctomycetia bacterium]